MTSLVIVTAAKGHALQHGGWRWVLYCQLTAQRIVQSHTLLRSLCVSLV